MISYICLSLFIILVYVSGSKLNSIDIPTSQFINKDIVRRTTFNDNTTITATTTTTLAIITTQSSVTIGQQLSARASVSGLASSSGTISTIPTNFIVKKDHYNSLHLSKSSSSASASASSTSTSTPSTVLVSSTLSNIESPSTYFPLPFELPTTTNTRTATATTTTKTTAAAAPAADGAAQKISNVGYINITSQAGTHVYLPCNVKQLVDRPISWIRTRDGHILTVDQTTFIADERFQSVYTDNPDRRWSLLIKYVQPRDSGSYECQVSTEPKMSARIHLNVIEPKTELLGESIRHVKAGSRVILRCIVSGGLEPPLYINWYFNKKQIILNNRNSWIIELNNHTLNGINTSNTNNDLKPNTIASLIIPSVTKKDSGNYTCSPSNSESITIVLHVLNGEYSASAITSGCSSNNIFHHKNLHNNHHLLVYHQHHHQHHHHNHHNHHLHHLHNVNRHHHDHHHRPKHHIKNHPYYSYYYHYYYQYYYKYYYNHSIIIILLLLHHLHHVLFNDNKIKYNNLIKIFIILFLFQFIFYNNYYYNTKLLRI